MFSRSCSVGESHLGRGFFFFFFLVEWGLSKEVAGLWDAVCVFCPGYFYWHFQCNPAGFWFVSCGYERPGDQSRNGKTLHAKATGERKEQHYQLFPAEKKNIIHKPIVFTKAVFLELSAEWCLYATEGLLLIIHHGCWKPPPSHLIHIGNQHKFRLRKHITGYKTHKITKLWTIVLVFAYILLKVESREHHVNNHMIYL